MNTTTCDQCGAMKPDEVNWYRLSNLSVATDPEQSGLWDFCSIGCLADWADGHRY